jgi:acyl-coenzyme A synthetase/AMP-(fatty) acid ligase
MSEVGAAIANVAQAAVDRHITVAQGQRTALRFVEKRYSFHDLAAIVNRVGNMLKRLAVAPGRHVVVALPESPAYVATMLGAMKIGAVPVILSGTIDKGALSRARAAVDPALVVIHQDKVAALDGTKPDAVVVVGQDVGAYMSFVELVREEPSSLSGARVEADAPALALFDGASLRVLKQGELVAALSQPPTSASGSERILDLLRALANGDEVLLA